MIQPTVPSAAHRALPRATPRLTLLRPLAGALTIALVLALPAPAVAQSPAMTPAAPVASPAQATADATTLDTVEVVGQRRPLSRFPGAVTVVDAVASGEGQRQVNLSEALQRVPGVTALDRGNYAQDLQVQSRGFGARSTFGIRGIRLVVDGIPASAADGQGQAANFPLGSLDRIEVLRGPLALQYGNAAGGAIVAYSDLDPADDGAQAEAWSGSHDSARLSARADGGSDDDAWRWRVQGAHFRTGGERPHSAAERTQGNAIVEWSPRAGDRVRAVANVLRQPDTQDPLGLSRVQIEADPRGTAAVAAQFNTRKRIDNQQAGLRWERDLGTGSAWVGGYGIRRDVVQYLSIPASAQAAPSSSGGVIDLGRRSSGMDAGRRWSGARGALAVGIEAGWLDEARRGFENFVGQQLGVRGALRRDEDNRIRNRELYVVGDRRFGEDWTVVGAARHARLDFASRDRYVAPGNGDDSGALDFSETAVSVGASRAFADGEVFAGIGRGFETPTVTELAYRADGVGGFNGELRAAEVLSSEVGLRWRWRQADATVALYRIDGNGEIVPAVSSGGRASFANAGRTRREGIEASVTAALSPQWTYAFGANAIRARFVDSYAFRVAAGGPPETRVVEAGNRIPGIPRADAFAEIAWRDAADRLRLALETRVSASIAVDDRNTDAASGYARFAVRGEWRPAAASRWRAFARVDNLFDREHVGSVIVNDGNGRYFEPGGGRSLTLGLAIDSRAR